jgi:hypothetical protein
MKTRTILTMSLLLVSLLSQHPSGARAAQQSPLPDLVIRSIVSIEDYKVVAVVSNFGKAASGICVVRLDIIDPNNPSHTLKTMEQAVPALAPGKYFEATFETSPQKARGNRIQLRVDPSNRVRESDEYNNRALDDSTAVKNPYATSGGFPKGTPPDLVIRSIAGTPSRKSALRVAVANIGGSQPSAPCTLTIQIFKTNSFKEEDLVESKDFPVPALKQGETKWVLIEVEKEFEQSDNKNHVTPLMPFRLTVDSKNVVEESQKANNKASYPVPTNYKP